MSTIAGILASFVASHLGGMVIGGALGRKELLGFGLKTLSAVSKRAVERRHAKARTEYQQWLGATTQNPETD